MDDRKNPATPAAVQTPVPASSMSDRQLLVRILRFSWKYRWHCAYLLLLQVALMATAILTVQLSGYGIDWIRFRLDQRVDLPSFMGWWQPPEGWPAFSQVCAIAALVLILSLARAALNFHYAVSSGTLINERMVVDLRVAVYEKMQRLSFRFFDANSASTLINRVTSDVHSTRAFVDGVMIQLTLLILSLMCYLATMFSIHVGLTWATIATTPLLAWATHRFSKKIKPEYDRSRELFDQMTLVVAENAEAAHVVKAFGQEIAESEKFNRASEAVQAQNRDIFWQVSCYVPTVTLLTQINLVLLILYGGYLVTQHQLSIGTGLVVFAGLLQQFSGQVNALATISNTIQQSLSGARRVFEILDTESSIQSPAKAHVADTLRGHIEFRNVSFGYQADQPVLKRFSLTVEPGECVAILGPVGSGKSTLLSLIPRFYDPDQGQILLDHIDLKDWELSYLRRSIGLVFQESFLFSNTIAANIAFGNPHATRAQITRAAQIAAADEFIVKLPNAYDTVLGEFGLTLSGGQRQRLAIARALLLDPPILLLDDPLAAVDPETEHEILTAMQQALRGRTSIVIAHRLSTLRQADRVAVLENGELTQLGTHEELLRSGGHYREVAHSQGIEI